MCLVNNPQELSQAWARFVRGDQEAFARLFQTFHPLLYRYGYRLTWDEELTRDCIQTVFLNFWSNREKLLSVSAAKPYLFRALRNEIIKRSEKGRKAGELHSSLTFPEPDVVFSAEELYTQAEVLQMKQEALAQALNKLSRREREIIYLRYYENLEYQEIAGVLSIQYQSVLNCLGSAFRKLRTSKTLRRVIDLSLPLLAGLAGYYA